MREITWEDMRLVDRILDKMIDDDISGKLPEEMTDEEYYTEVLKRFKEAKGPVYIPTVWLEGDVKSHPSEISSASYDYETGEFSSCTKYYDGDGKEISWEEYKKLTKNPGDVD